jgi:site-specific DNA-methyltransferase (adenine-specific)
MYKIKNIEALKFLENMETGQIDALITDPPYSSGGQNITNRVANPKNKYGVGQKTPDFSGDNRDQRSYEKWLYLWLSESQRVLKAGGFIMLFTDWRQLSSTIDSLQVGGFTFRGVVPWHKPHVRPQPGRFQGQCEYVIWGSNGHLPMDRSAPVFKGFYTYTAPRDKQHMTQKPLELMRDLIQIVPEGGSILDPFMGSGTTGVAALLENRSFYGCELSEHYYNVAKKRLEEVDGTQNS